MVNKQCKERHIALVTVDIRDTKSKGPFIATQLNSTADPVEQRRPTANQREASQSCFCL